MDVDTRFREAIQSYWTARTSAKARQAEAGTIDASTRGEVTAGTQMGALEVLVADILEQAGLSAWTYARGQP